MVSPNSLILATVDRLRCYAQARRVKVCHR